MKSRLFVVHWQHHKCKAIFCKAMLALRHALFTLKASCSKLPGRERGCRAVTLGDVGMDPVIKKGKPCLGVDAETV